MVIFYDDQGNIIGTVDGFNDTGVQIRLGDKFAERLNIHIGHELEGLARRHEDPLDSFSMLNHRIINGQLSRKPNLKYPAKQVDPAKDHAKNYPKI